MRKRLSSKLLAVILTVAICATTVFGCLMTVNAADSCYSFSSVEVSDDLTEATIGVTFKAPASLPNGFIAGAFSINEVDADAADKLTIKSVSGSGVSAEIEGNNVVFNTDAAKSIATVQLTFGFSKGKATKGKDYKIQLSGIELAYNDSEYYVESATGAIGKISTECEHVIGVVGEPLKIDTANNYSVYENSVCTICGEEFGIQLVPTAEKLNADGAAGTVTGKVVYWDNTKTAPTSTAAGTEDDPIIINTPAELAYIATATNSAGTVNPDKYYKIADDIKAFVLQPETYGADIMALSGSDAVSAYFSDTSKTFYQWQGVSDTTNIFSGRFDGNGITIYGLYNTQNGKRQGLFGEVDGNATISNVTVKGAYITTTQGWNDQGAIVGGNRNKYGVGPGTSGQDTLVIKNCSVIDCYMRSSDTANDNRAANGVIAGRSNNGLIMIDSCFVSGNDTLFTNNTLSQEYSLYGNALNSWNIDSSSPYFRGAYDNYYPNAVATAATGSCICNMVVNTVAIGTLPYHLGYYGNRLDNKECFINVYTDGPAGTVANSYVSGGNTVSVPTTYAENQIASVATENLKGSAAAVNMPNLDWGKTWLVGKEGEYPYLAAPDYVSDTICWDGTVATGIAEGSGSDTDPFIINSVSELAYVVALGNETEGKYYKIADGIKNVVLQNYAYANDIMALDSAADVQAYFEGNSITPQQWIYKGWAANAFSGKFDGNGATVYGMYSAYKDGAGNSNPALFPTIDTGAEISNLALKNSYVYGREGWDAGLISAIVASGTYGTGKNNGVVEFNNCAVINNYMRYYTNRGAIFFASAQGEVAKFENILVYGNDAKNMTGDIPSLAIGMKNDMKDDEGNFIFASFENMVVFGALPYAPSMAHRVSEPQCFSNVYTDAPAGEVYAGNPFAENQVKSVSVADILGTKAQLSVNLAWGTDWYCGANGEPPVLAPFATLGASDKSTFEHQLYGSSVTYNNDGTLDFNLHFVPQYEGIEATLYVGTADTSKFYKLTATESSYRNDLGGTALMFTLPNISARDIDKVWLPTLVVEGGEKTEWGKTQPVALVDNAMGVLEGDYDAADKKVSAALINYGVTADDALSTPSTEKDVATKIVYTPSNMYDGSFMTDAAEGVGDTEDNPYIISTYGHWRYIAEKATFDETYGKFFKVDPTIKMFVFQSESYMKKLGGLDAFLKLDAEGVKTALSTETGRTYHNAGSYESNDNIEFAGTLDGSGVEIVAMYNGCGLFSQVCEGASFKNITVSHSYINSGWYNGAVVGMVNTDTATADNIGKVSFENIIVHDNYQTTTGTGWSQTGTLLGEVYWSGKYISINIENVISYDNVALGQVSGTDTTMKECGLVGQFNGSWNGGIANPNGSYKNIITLGNAPYPVAAQQNQGSKPEYFVNVYTDTITAAVPGTTNSNVGLDATKWSSYDITLIDAGENNENIKNGGAIALCPKIDWTNKWISASDNGYPAPVQKDVTIKTVGSTIYWDGTYNGENSIASVNDTGAAGTSWETAIIIDNAQELYYVLRVAGVDNTVGKYFKVADGIDNIVLQPEGVLDLEELLNCKNGTEVKAYFDTLDTSKLVEWKNGGVFDGNIDGNGVQIIGLYDVSSNLAGFVGAFDGGAKSTAGTTAADVANDNVGIFVKNFIVKNAYLVSNNRLGTFGAQSYSPGWGANVNGILNLDGCAVINSYLKNTAKNYYSNHSGVVTGDVNEVVKMNNILVYGNDSTDTNGVALWLRGAGINNARKDDSDNFIYNSVDNSIIIGADPFFGNNGTYGLQNRRNDIDCFENLFTNYAIPTYQTFAATDAQQIAASDIIGSNAQSIVNTLNAKGTVWYVGALDDVPGFKPAGNVPSLYQSAIDSVVFSTPDTVGAGTEYYDTGSMKFGVYQTALSLKANPYMSFAFAFGDDYKTNRDKIKIRFTYTENGALTTSEEISVPAYTGEDIKNVNGWTNTTANGRFHTFKADMIPVEALAYGIKVEVNYNNTGWKDFGTYSVEGLGMQFDALSKTQPGDYYSTRVEAAKALLFYAQAIAARYGAQ